MLTLDKIYHAAFVLRDVARRTDLIAASRLNSASDLYLKTENLQVTGSFKVRGAYYKISQLTAEERAKGVIACSAGNHAQGVTVSEDEIAAAILALMENQKLVAEGAGATPVAAALFGKLPIEGKKTVCLISGGNIDVNILVL